MKKHTPGPWKVVIFTGHKDESGGDFVGKIENAKGINIYSGAFSFNSINNLANAQLIAAAPELLQACKAIASYEERCRARGKPAIAPTWFNMVKNAIKSAQPH